MTDAPARPANSVPHIDVDRGRPRRRGAILVVTAWTLVMIGLNWLRIWVFFAGAFDLGVFVHGLRTVWFHGLAADVPLLGQPLLADHFSPLLLPLVGVAAWDLAPYSLVAVQAIAVGCAGWLVWRAADRRGARWPLAHMIGFLVAPIVAFGTWNDFHPSVLVLPLLVVYVDRVGDHATSVGLWAGSLAALAREDVALLVLGIAILWWPTRRAPGPAAVAITSLGFSALLGSGSWFVRAGTRYLSEQWPPAAVAEEVWDGGRIILLAALVAIPWLFLGRIPIRHLLAGGLIFLPLMALDLPQLDHVGFHYFALMAPVLSIGAIEGGPWARLTTRTGVVASALALVIGPLGLAWGGTQNLPASLVVREWASHRTELADTHRWLEGLPLGVTVSAASMSSPWISGDRTVWAWPAPFEDVVLSSLSSVPLVAADPTATVTDVIAMRPGWTGYGPTGDTVGLRDLGFVPMGSSPDGRFQWWRHR